MELREIGHNNVSLPEYKNLETSLPAERLCA
jgi:hypothetical protein